MRKKKEKKSLKKGKHTHRQTDRHIYHPLIDSKKTTQRKRNKQKKSIFRFPNKCDDGGMISLIEVQGVVHKRLYSALGFLSSRGFRFFFTM